jgi:phenylacetate-CoA ligase
MKSVLHTRKPAAHTPLARAKAPNNLERRAERTALLLFREAAERVPAYRHFLRAHRVQPSSIRTIADFSALPATTKQNYIHAYPLEQRSWDGTIRGHSILAMSSGTTGSPTLWPRGLAQEREAAAIHDWLFDDLFQARRRTTLAAICFPMGIYVSGMATTLPLVMNSASNDNLSVAPIGNNRDNALSFLREFGSSFEQIVLVGHPFFLKSLVEAARAEQATWLNAPVRMLCCSEGFSEDWREYVAKLAHANPLTDLFSTYGSSEFLLVGYENPYTIALRRFAAQNAPFARALFGAKEIPSLFQYDPTLRFIETAGDELLITAKSGIPLIRFNQHDGGSLLSERDIAAALTTVSRAQTDEIRRYTRRRWELPFVSLHGRTDRTLTFYAANIYPENVQAALGEKRYVSLLTGKFAMEIRHTKSMDQELVIHIELVEKGKGGRALELQLAQDIEAVLKRVNSEYADALSHVHKPMSPIVTLHPYAHPRYFPQGVKPRYLLK